MRRTSKTNSRRFVDLPLRRLYATENSFDEIAFYCGVEFDSSLNLRQTWTGIVIDASDVNHLFTSPRRDWWCNLISVSRRTHDAFHKRLPEGRVLAMLAKLRKAEKKLGDAEKQFDDADDVVLSDWDISFGRSVLGWTQCQRFDGEPMWRFQDELISRLEWLAVQESK